MLGKLTISFLFITTTAFAAIPFKSKEEVGYAAKKSFELAGFAKADQFQGVIMRTYEKNRDLSSVDHYQFAKVDSLKMDKAICEKWLTEVFGDLKGITLKVSVVEIFKTSSGDACEALAKDENDPKSHIPERRIILGFIKDQPTALVFKLSKKSDAAVQENIRTFWQGLR